MIDNHYKGSMLFLLVFGLGITHYMYSEVTGLSGDTGSEQGGSVVLSGAMSGAKFHGDNGTLSLGFNFISLPITTASTGQVIVGGSTILHNYGESRYNIFVGEGAGNFTLTGDANTACGVFGLNALTAGSGNTAIGGTSLANLTTGVGNIAIGAEAALNLVDGNNNIVVGPQAGNSYVGGESNNIIIGSGISGESSEVFVTRIGDPFSQQACYIGGIYSAIVDSVSSLPVYVDEQGKLGTVISSSDAKANIHSVKAEAITRILKLRPVSFFLRADPKKTLQYGLIAEEVDTIFPELVVRDGSGRPIAVKYHELPVLLLRELQRKEEQIKDLKKNVRTLEERIKKLEHFCKLGN